VELVELVEDVVVEVEVVEEADPEEAADPLVLDELEVEDEDEDGHTTEVNANDTWLVWEAVYPNWTDPATAMLVT